jgi:hypothetical protein
MTAAACLIAYSVVVAVLAPRALVHRTHLDRLPRLGVTIWLAAVLSVLAAWLAAAVAAAVDVALSAEVRHVVARCVASFCAAALGAHGDAGQWLAFGSAAVLSTGTVVAALGLSRALVRLRARTHRHADAARLLGRYDGALGAVVLDVPERIVYAVTGRPPAVVVSSGALQSLDEDELRVVLAHERAHLAGRHHLVLGVIGALHRVLPRVPLFVEGERELARLIEMCADDVAVRDHDVRHLVRALLALSAPAHVPGPALAAATTGVARRAERLSRRPDRRALRRTRAVVSAGSVALLAAPALVGALACGVLPLGL